MDASAKRAPPSLSPEKRVPTAPARKLGSGAPRQHSRTASLSAHAAPITDVIPENSTDDTSAKQKREHSRNFSRIHSRNLSAFFPRPGTEAEREMQTAKANNLEAPVGEAPAGELTPEQASLEKRRHRRNERRVSYLLAHAASESEQTPRWPSSSQLAPVTPDLSQLISPDISRHRSTSAAWSSLPSRSVSGVYSPVEATTPEPTQALPCSKSTLLGYSAIHFSVGVVLWVLGQVRDSLALVGFGLLMVFDTLGLIHAAISPLWASTTSDEKSLQRPYGLLRVETLYDFSAVVYLLFAGIYMCKENAEHALLASSSPHEEDRDGLHLPSLLLCLVLLLCIGTNVVLRNHARLAAACGINNEAVNTNLDGRHTKRTHTRNTSVLARPIMAAGPMYDAFMNPFSAMILFFAMVLAVAAFVLPPANASAFDKILAGLEGASMMYVSVTALKPLCKILLQASPPSTNVQVPQLYRALHNIESHHAVVRLNRVQMWQLTLPSLVFKQSSAGVEQKTGLAGVMSKRSDSKQASLVVHMHVHVKQDATERDCMEVTQFAWQQCAPILGVSPHVKPGDALHGSRTAGDLVIQVTREGEQLPHDHHSHDHDHHHHHSHHHHHHDHSHGHNHEHHTHHHDHSHEHHKESSSAKMPLPSIVSEVVEP